MHDAPLSLMIALFDLLLVIFIHRVSHGSRNTANRYIHKKRKKCREKIHTQQSSSGQVPILMSDIDVTFILLYREISVQHDSTVTPSAVEIILFRM